jgi:hypothetical protein
MRIDPWTLSLAALRAALPPAALELPVLRPEAGSLESSHESFRRITSSAPARGPAHLFGGAPVICGLSLEELGIVVGAAGVATLLIRGAQKLFAFKTHPFGELSALNELVCNWAVTDEDEARSQARRIGDAFLAQVKARRGEYDDAYLQVAWTIDPKRWAQKDEERQRLTTRYAKDISENFRDFAQGVSILSRGDWGHVYKDVFGGFLQNVALAAGPLTRWEPPLNDEDLANFRHFEKVLRREVLALEMKLEAISLPQVV